VGGAIAIASSGAGWRLRRFVFIGRPSLNKRNDFSSPVAKAIYAKAAAPTAAAKKEQAERLGEREEGQQRATPTALTFRAFTVLRL